MTAPAAAPPETTTDTNAVRTESREVVVHLTAFAPGCEKYGVDNPGRWRRFFLAAPRDGEGQPLAKPLNAVMAALLSRVRRAPGEVTLEPQLNGDLAFLGAHECDVLDDDEENAAGAVAPLLFICDGLPFEAELRAAQRDLHARRWRPAGMPPRADTASPLSALNPGDPQL